MSTHLQGQSAPAIRSNPTQNSALLGELVRVSVAVDAASCLLDLAIRRPDQTENISVQRLDVILDALADATGWLGTLVEGLREGGR
ncbi:MAG: hypothetical protein PHT19_10445 [Methylococcus sp.]|nr:hypothetical protein [Methylococcus sp.]